MKKLEEEFKKRGDIPLQDILIRVDMAQKEGQRRLDARLEQLRQKARCGDQPDRDRAQSLYSSGPEHLQAVGGCAAADSSADCRAGCVRLPSLARV